MIWESQLDAPREQMYGVHSEKDKAFWAGLQAINAKYPHSQLHNWTHWQVYTKRILHTRYLAHYELFKMTLDIPGSIVELAGTARGLILHGTGSWKFSSRWTHPRKCSASIHSKGYKTSQLKMELLCRPIMRATRARGMVRRNSRRRAICACSFHAITPRRARRRQGRDRPS